MEGFEIQIFQWNENSLHVAHMTNEEANRRKATGGGREEREGEGEKDPHCSL